MGIEYSDGSDVESRIQTILRNARDLSSTTPLAYDDAPWAIRYHLSPQRANLLRHLDFTGLRVLEFGAGMGAISRYLAEEAKYLKIIEGTQARYDAAKERLRDLDNWDGEVANIEDVTPQERFDVVCAIGVMEYSELFLSAEAGKTPFDRFVELAKSHLRPGGVLVLAIENQLGVKYWSGASEDHTNQIADGISGYSANPTPRTLPRVGLNNLFLRNGFTEVREYYPFPDYKIPSTVLGSELMDREPTLAAQLAVVRQFESYNGRRVRFFSDVLAVHSLSEAGLLRNFSNSFLSVAKLDGCDDIFNQINGARDRGELAWHYSMGRAHPIATVFQDTPNGIWATKRRLPTHQSKNDAEGWTPLSEPVLHAESLRSKLIRTAFFDGTEAALSDFITFLEAAVVAFAHAPGCLTPNSLDAIYQNAMLDDASGYRWFDLEWINHEPVATSWFVLRNLLVLRGDQEVWIHDGQPYSLKKIYNRICSTLNIKPNLSDDMQNEAQFRSRVSNERDPQIHLEAVRAAVRQRFIGITYPRRTGTELYLRHIYGVLSRPSAALLLHMPFMMWRELKSRRK